MSRRARQRPWRIGAIVIVGALLAGCGPTLADPAPRPTHLDLGAVDVAGTERNGIEYLTGADALTVAIRAMRAGGAVAVTGDFERAANDDEGIPAGSVHLEFAGTSSAYVATIVADGTSYDIRVRGLTGAVTDSTTPEVWTCVAADAAIIRRWAPLLDPAEFVKALLGDGSGLAVSPPRGEPAIVEIMLGATEGASGAFTVSAEGDALPSRLVLADGSSWAEFSYSGWGTDVDVQLPDSC